MLFVGRLLLFFNINCFEIFFQEYHQACQTVGPGLDSNCLQVLSADETSRKRVNGRIVYESINID